jgi:hypothetical protein
MTSICSPNNASDSQSFACLKISTSPTSSASFNSSLTHFKQGGIGPGPHQKDTLPIPIENLHPPTRTIPNFKK